MEWPLTLIGRRFALSDKPGSGVSCGENGVCVGTVPLLEKAHGAGVSNRWHPRPLSDLNRELSACYGLPVDFDRKIDALEAIARALGRGDLAYAQIATLHLQIPDPPPLTKSARAPGQIIDLAHHYSSPVRTSRRNSVPL